MATKRSESLHRLGRFYHTSRSVGLSVFRPIYLRWHDVWIVGVISISPNGERLEGGKGRSTLSGYPASVFIRATLDLPAKLTPYSFQATINHSVFYAVDLTLTDGGQFERGRPYLPEATRPLPLLDNTASTSNGGIVTGVLIRSGLPYAVEYFSCIACVSGYHFFDDDRGKILIDARTVSELCSTS